MKTPNHLPQPNVAPVALVTGHESGLGYAIARLLHGQGYKVIGIPGALCHAADYMALRQFLTDLGDEVLQQVTVFINNYGTNHLSWIGETPVDDVDAILRVNVSVPYWLINELFRHVGAREERHAMRIVNVASQTYRIPQRTTSLYCASKAALVHMTKVMARELAPKGWIINAVAPGKMLGTTMTKLTDQQVNELRGWTQDEADRYALSLQPMGRFTTTYEVAQAINLLLKMPAYVNGATLDVTGAA